MIQRSSNVLLAEVLDTGLCIFMFTVLTGGRRNFLGLNRNTVSYFNRLSSPCEVFLVIF